MIFVRLIIFTVKIFPVFRRSAIHFLFKAFIIIAAAAETHLLGNLRNAEISCGKQLYALCNPKADQIEERGCMLYTLEYTAAFTG